MLKQEVVLPKPYAPEVFLIAMGDEAKDASFVLLHELRQRGISALMDFGNRKLNKLMQYANQIQAENVVVIGENELKTGSIEMKTMSTGEKRTLPLDQMAQILHHEKEIATFHTRLEELSEPFGNPSTADFFIKNLENTISQASQATENLKNAMHKMQDLLK
jgi:hypothetical protein